jgi:maltose/moltooligosaccharide transporter
MTKTISAAPQQLIEKPRLSVWQIFTMSFGFLGIQFGFALQNGNTSRILRSFGADVDRDDCSATYWSLQ